MAVRPDDPRSCIDLFRRRERVGTAASRGLYQTVTVRYIRAQLKVNVRGCVCVCVCANFCTRLCGGLVEELKYSGFGALGDLERKMSGR